MTRAPRIAKDAPPHTRKPDPRRQDEHRRWVKLLPCLGCGKRPPSDPAHLRFNEADPKFKGAMGLQPPDWLLVPLCRKCHNTEERGKLTFWASRMSIGISDPKGVAGELRRYSGDTDRGYRAIQHARRGLPTAAPS
jgi:hypothetical protein